ncbi:dUTP pyrophosphatase [Nematocida homosporus]|uniref:dUTP pyrophosphatase n=1 Tax=Nematocida homosporus TaxID=1912981 RepID=UPI00221F5F5C|nr:dUTP pyrophosphatase [Nematocida homosporus]KAI5187106.1 dUTP pyrophosphatase [Nematocida homosporus]
MTTLEPVSFNIQLLNDKGRCPKRATPESAGYDLYSAETGCINPGERKLISIGIAMKIPTGYYGQISSRSGLCSKHGVITLGGVIDSDYRGELFVMLLNTGSQPFEYAVHDRIAQILIIPVFQAMPQIVESLSATERAAGGFGSTGK